jgi:short-subunit dehydrogenase
MNESRQTALITGASSGIGLELARSFAAGGFDLVLVARNKSALDAIAGELAAAYSIKAAAFASDLSDAAAPAALYERLRASGARIDVLVNNAGFGVRGNFLAQPAESQFDMVEVNVSALTRLSRLFGADMLARGRGRILNVASTAAFQPGPGMAVYYATKSYVLSLSEAMSEELAGTGVTVTCLCPGPTATGFAAAAKMEDALLFKLGAMDARTVARLGYEATLEGRRLIVTGLRNKLGAFFVRFSPRGLVLKFAKRLQA